MAKQKGIVTFTGTLGGINFYYRKGKPVARMAGGGFNRTAIKTSPSMKRVREQNNEFAQCSRLNKAFKLALQPLLVDYNDGTLHSRLMQLFLKLKDLDSDSVHGKRTVAGGMASVYGPQLIQDFVFNPQRPTLLPCSTQFDWSSLTFTASGFDLSSIDFPEGADYFELQLGLIWFDFEALCFSGSLSSVLKIDTGFNDDTFELSVSGLPNGDGHCFAGVRLAFYQERYGKRYALTGGNGFGFSILGFL